MKIQDIHPFGVRMPDELKKELAKEAKLNGRSLNSEIVGRLRRSLDKQRAAATRYGVAEPEAAQYVARSDGEREMLALFRRWPAEKQLALLSLFK